MTTVASSTALDYDSLPTIDTVEALVELIGAPQPAARDKARPTLHELDKQWLAASPLCFIGTSGADGSCDVSPKGDPAGFVKVLDDTTIAIPERQGNKRVDGYQNIVINPHVGVNFLIPGRGDTLRINGRARLVSDAPFFEDMVGKGHRPILALLVSIDQVFYHCAKAFLRAKAWDPETWDPTAVPRHAVIAKELVRKEQSLDELDEYYGEQYSKGLYPQNQP